MSHNQRISIHQGSIIALTNEEGQIVERITYDGHFGEIMEHTKHEITHNPYGYTGREMDTLRLYYYRARYYSPIFHRFLSPDPIEHASGDYNWYRYVGNDPVNFVDPSGLYVDPRLTSAGVPAAMNGSASSTQSFFGSIYDKFSKGIQKVYARSNDIKDDIVNGCKGFSDADLPMKKIGKDVLKAIKGGAEGLNKIQNLDTNKYPAAAPFVNLINTSKYTGDMALRGKYKIIDTIKHFHPTVNLPNADKAQKATDKVIKCLTSKCSHDNNASR